MLSLPLHRMQESLFDNPRFQFAADTLRTSCDPDRARAFGPPADDLRYLYTNLSDSGGLRDDLC
jgi:hypothetical protein